jgi:hypothetical protein
MSSTKTPLEPSKPPPSLEERACIMEGKGGATGEHCLAVMALNRYNTHNSAIGFDRHIKTIAEEGLEAMEQKEIAMIGRISAAMTHEMRNVLAIIRESSGLMQDILALSEGASFPHRDKFTNALAKIEKHVRRGDEIVTQFNTFAHSMDEPRDWVEVNELINLVAILMERFARSKEVTLSAEPLDGAPSLYTNPVRLMLALAACVEQFVNQAASEDAIVLRPNKEKDKAVIEILVKKASVETGPVPCDLTDVTEVLKALDGEVRPVVTGDRGGLRLVLPLK